ncbi:MAG: hypothetical protein A2654_02135 [Candidatus Nealsonbacteria bacterium RIFCSPHIGHO2_01_FULL_43_31]|uniref:Methyltransferase type 11 domain-containing protein n=1 Tax=Candidatus Nealsonbacteria bacterium RIFCSPHIGHO2_01_FULL_43_31 TaxID=1801665 RepID=A0A1G2E2F9_9BACT|nr:MAG: hypothetical protein A2654_02135 [Candidatus Nealsonbacteria bacterium RIFCSPHIGHO2_01_FULL_43_31]OGZ24957.1 MAG: hypothetical protein A2922_02505 [Candidatus Nealsonbacteria bacterium RIFCSPLOWO2_01_FULL_43_36]
MIFSLRKIKNNLIVNIRQLIFRLDEKFPLIGRPLVIGWRFFCILKFITEKKALKFKARLEYSADKLDFDKICWANPQKIKYCLRKAFNKWQNYGKILEGNWDQPGPRFEELDSYQASKQRFLEGKKWEETKFYQRILGYISSGEINRGCSNKEELDERFKKIDLLYDQIKENGYKSKKELYSPQGWLEELEQPLAILDDVSVAVGREGQFLFIDGRHRLSIAKLLNLPEIPIRIITRHRKWMDFRKELIAFSKNYQGGELYQPLTHPDLQDIPHHRQDERLPMIKNNLSVKNGTLLDIGANLGYFCHKFEDEGLACYALEENRMCLYFLNKLKIAEKRKFKIIPQSIFEYQKNKEIVFDAVLALSIFHHFLEKKDAYLNLIKLLKRLKAKELFFESYVPKEFGSRPFYQKYTPDQFVDFIIANSCFKKAELLGKSIEGRPLYKFTC